MLLVKIVPKNSKITNDSVALEAGRSKGSIKKSRHVFADLILAISNASNEQSQIKTPHIDQIEKLKEEVNFYKKSWEESLAHICLLVKYLVLINKILISKSFSSKSIFNDFGNYGNHVFTLCV